MFFKGKVSIIVPIYKVEKYIHQCVESILNQTYTHLEIILVDDGSPDSCGIIADELKDRDTRIKVIHKENGGLSDARNAGMEKATGEFTMFVDSDDWLDPNMIENMVYHGIASEADIVQSGFYYAYEDKLLIDNRYYQEDEPAVTLDNKRLMYELVKNEKVKNFAWGKLYQTKLIKKIPFTKGVLFEDVFWAHHVMHHVDSYLMIHQPFYYYRQREDSIVAAYTPRNLDMIKGLKSRHRFIEHSYQELIDESYKTILKMSLIHYNLLVQHKKKDKQKIHRKEIEFYIKENIEAFKNAVKNDKRLKRKLYLFSIHPYLNILYLILRKALRKMHILTKPAGLRQVNL